MRVFKITLTLAASLSVTTAFATSPVSHLTLVGVISDSQAGSQGVAVVKDAALKKTLMLRRGDHLPDGSGFVVHSIDRKVVLVSNGVETMRVEHAPAPVEEAPKGGDNAVLSEENAVKVFEGDADVARARLERLLQPLERRHLVTPVVEENGEPLTFEKLKAELLDVPTTENEEE